jgi:hypothetical protein
MPKTPTGAKRPADVTQNAVLVMRIATGEIEEKIPNAGQAKGGIKGGKARADALSVGKRKAIAKKAAKARWGTRAAHASKERS